MVSKPTRGDNVLDLFPTSNQTLINKVEILSDISDHEISISNISVKPKMSRQKPRSVPLYRKTDWGSFRTYSKTSEILGSFQESTVEEIWNDLKTALDSGIQQFIPIKKLSSKRSLAWITLEIVGSCAKEINFIINKNQDQTRIGVTSSRSSILCKEKLKLLMKIIWQTYSGWVLVTGMKILVFLPRNFNLLKNSWQDNQGISTLKDSENTLHSGNVKKANLLNSQFQSFFFFFFFFSRLSHLR